MSEPFVCGAGGDRGVDRDAAERRTRAGDEGVRDRQAESGERQRWWVVRQEDEQLDHHCDAEGDEHDSIDRQQERWQRYCDGAEYESEDEEDRRYDLHAHHYFVTSFPPRWLSQNLLPEIVQRTLSALFS